MIFTKTFLVFCLTAFILSAQSDSTKTGTARETDNTDASTLVKKYFLFELKMKLNSITVPSIKNDINHLPGKNIWESAGFSNEELNSRLSIDELNAYKKNKEFLKTILARKFDEQWWYNIKSLGELTGIPDWFIKIIQFSLFLF